MTQQRRRYADDHWLRSHDPESALHAYKEQQNTAYSRVKNAFIRELLGDLHGRRFLDFGCGAGMFAVYAATQGASLVLGVDAEQNVLATARYFADQEGVGRECRFLCAETFPSFDPGVRFDVILMKDVLEHVVEDQALLDAGTAVMAPGGVMVISTQNAMSLNYLIEGTYHRVLRRDKDWYGWDPTHLRFYTPFSLENKLRKAGLTSVAWRSVYLVPYKLPSFPGSGRQFLRIDPLARIDRTLGAVFPYNRLGWNIIVKAEASRLVTKPRPFFQEVVPLACPTGYPE
jgi:2-polyprenyl-6-hydroxyphenyl methylase/3-demethylubiquinone-9 3-methyltransferase